MSAEISATVVHVVRHGRTALNAGGRFRGLADPDLDDVGKAEVTETAARLAARSLAAIATSPLRRAVQTAAAVAQATKLTPEIDRGLLDLDVGRWQGLTAADAAERDPDLYRRYLHEPRSAVTPGGEALAEVESRIRSAVEALAAAHAGEEVVAVSHEAPIKLLVSGVIGVDGPAVWALDIPTASVVTLRRGARGWSLVDLP